MGWMDVALRSRLLDSHGFAHGFSLRTGGASEPPYDTLNLGRSVGDDPSRVRENHVRFARAVGYGLDSLYEVSQVHGAAVRRVGPDEPPRLVRPTEADALVISGAGRAVAVRVADCLPVLLADPGTGRVAAVHAGWRGTEAGVVRAAVAVLREAGSVAGRLLAAIGPHIRAASFEVGEDVAERLAAAAPGEDVVLRGPGRPHVDLAAIVRSQLLGAGVAADRIDDVGGCTFAEPERFFSFRRDGARSGRHLGAIVAR